MKSIAFEFEFTVTIDLFLFSISFSLSVSLEIEFKRDLSRGMPVIQITSGVYVQRFANEAHTLRSGLGSGVLLEDAFPSSHVLLSQPTPNGLLLGIWEGFDNTIANVLQARIVVFSVYYSTVGSWDPPTALPTSTDVSDTTPSVVLFGTDKAAVVWLRTDLTGVDPTTVDPSALTNRSEVVSATYTFSTGTWSPVTHITTNTIFDGFPQVITLGSGKLITVWIADNGTDFTKVGERDFMYSIYSSSAWGAPNIAIANTSVPILSSTRFSIAATDTTVLLAFISQEPSNRTTESGPSYQSNPLFGAWYARLMIGYYDTTSGVWSAPEYLMMEVEYQPTNYRTVPIPDSNPSVTVHDGRFVVAWLHGDSIVYKVWTPTSMQSPIVTLESTIPTTNLTSSPDLEDPAENAQQGSPHVGGLSTLSVTHSDDFTVISYVKSTGEFTGFSYAVMETGSYYFGTPVYVQKTEAKLYDQNADVVIIPTGPAILRVFTERTRKKVFQLAKK